MKSPLFSVLLMATLGAGSAFAQTPSDLTCDDFRPTAETLAKYPMLKGACEDVVEIDGELYARFKAVVRRAAGRSVTLYLPATDRTFRVEPEPGAQVVLIGGGKIRPRELVRGQEISIHLSTRKLAEVNVDEIAFTTVDDLMLTHRIIPVEALPTTASPWPAVALGGVVLLGIAGAIRRLRVSQGTGARS